MRILFSKGGKTKLIDVCYVEDVDSKTVRARIPNSRNDIYIRNCNPNEVIHTLCINGFFDASLYDVRIETE